MGGNLRVVQNLESDDAFESSRGIIDDVGEITIERKQDRLEFLGLGNDCGIGRLRGQVILKAQNLMAQRLPVNG